MDIIITIAFLALYYILGLGTVIALKTGIEENDCGRNAEEVGRVDRGAD